MGPAQRYRVKILTIGILVAIVAMIVVYCIFVATAWGHEFNNDAFFGRSLIDRDVVVLNRTLLSSVNALSLLALLAVIVIAGWLAREPVPGICAAAGVAVAIVGAQVFKGVLPWQMLVPTDHDIPPNLQMETYPSGHSTIGTSLALTVILLAPATARMWVAVGAGALTALFGTAVVFAGWHRPADAIGGALWAGIVFGIVGLFLVWLKRVHRSPQLDDLPGHGVAQPFASAGLRAPLIVSAIAAVVVWGLGLAGSLADGVTGPDLDAPFLWSTFLIVVTSFSVTAWYGYAMRRVPEHFAQSRHRLNDDAHGAVATP